MMLPHCQGYSMYSVNKLGCYKMWKKGGLTIYWSLKVEMQSHQQAHSPEVALNAPAGVSQLTATITIPPPSCGPTSKQCLHGRK